MAVYHVDEWQDTLGYWHCNDTSDLGKGSGYWWHAARACNLTPAAYIEKLIKDFKPEKISYDMDKNLLFFSFVSQVSMRNYKHWINREARKNNYQI